MSNIPVADAHCDFLYYMTQDGWDINRPTRNQAVALPYIKQGGGKLLLFTSPWNIDWATEHNPKLKLSEFGNVTF